MTNERRIIQNLLNNGPVEVRTLGKKRYTGIFNEYSAFKQSVIQLMSKKINIYNTINPVNMKVTNKMEPAITTTKDKDITRILRLPFDFDPVRETDTGATDEQVADALAVAGRFTAWMGAHGWVNPLLAMSGNGYHVVYETDMQNTPETKEALRGLYKALELRFSTDTVKFDVTVRNPSRIMRTYGTVNQKSGRRTWCRRTTSRVRWDA